MKTPYLRRGTNGPFLSGQPRGVVRVALREFYRHYWRYLRLAHRKGFIVKISKRKGGEPVVVLVPHWLYKKWQAWLADLEVS